MTTTAWDGSARAADRRISGDAVTYPTTKTRCTSDGRLIGATGRFGVCGQVLDRRESGARRPACRESGRWATALEIMPDGTCWMHDRDSRWRVEGPFVAVGPNRDDAMRAVQVASRFDPGTGHCADGLRLLTELGRPIA